MTHSTPSNPEILHRRIRAHLDRVDRIGDRERIAQRIAALDSRDATVVGFRREGRELVVYEPDGENVPAELTIYAVGRAGRLDRIGRLWRGRELDRWLASHHHYLEWIRPGLDSNEADVCDGDGRRPGNRGARGGVGRRRNRAAAPCERATRPFSEP